METPFVTAMIGINDMVAYGILDALHSAGHTVPDEYSVCGFDNIFPSQGAKLWKPEKAADVIKTSAAFSWIFIN